MPVGGNNANIVLHIYQMFVFIQVSIPFLKDACGYVQAPQRIGNCYDRTEPVNPQDE